MLSDLSIDTCSVSYQSYIDHVVDLERSMCTSFLINDILLESPKVNDGCNIGQPMQQVRDDTPVPDRGAEISDNSLLRSSLSDFKQMCKGLNEETVTELKKRRRTLKNRQYQAISRKRRSSEVKELHHEVVELRKQLLAKQESL